MRMKRARVGTTVLNKLNGQEYRIIEANDTYALGAKIIGRNKLDELVLDTEHCVQINEENSICFRVLKDAEPTIPEGYFCKDGYLFDHKSNIVTKQGTIRVKEILGKLPGILILSCNTENEAEGITIKIYDLDRDKFTSVLTTNTSPQFTMVEDVFVVKHSETYMEKDEKDVETEYFDNAGLTLISRKVGKPLDIKYIPFFFPLDKILGCCGGNVYVQVSKKTVSDNKVIDILPFILQIPVFEAGEGKETKIPLNPEKGFAVSNCYINGGYVVSNKEDICVVDADGSIVLFVKSEEFADLLMSGDYMLVDIAKNSHEHKTKVLLSTDNYRMKEVTITSTSDRGDITEITEKDEVDEAF